MLPAFVPTNEPVDPLAPGAPSRQRLEASLRELAASPIEVPCWVDGRPVRTDGALRVAMPHAHAHLLAHGHAATAELTQQAIDGALRVAPMWAQTSFEHRAAIFLRAAELLTGPHRARILAACMLGQSKTAYQAEIDAICELADFLRFNVAFLRRLHDEQPISPPGQWNRLELRPLEGFVFAVTPFNFLAIAANLPCAPLLCGNVVVWKPATTSLFGCQLVLELLREAGLPEGVLQMLPGDGVLQGQVALASPHLAGIHFTGSTGTFQHFVREVGSNITRYRAFPRLVGETGGKDFILAHRSADPTALAVAIVRGAFEYQGQKCSAASRLYLPRSLWPEVRERVVAELAVLCVGDVRDLRTFMGAVIDARAYQRITSYQALAKATARVVAGGGASDAIGYFVEPTLVEVDDPKHRLMEEEIFGPLATAFVYDDARFDEVLGLVDETSPYALTGAIFARDRHAIDLATSRLRQSAGNFYVNDKPTGAVVGQQPFGGARLSGTNDKAGSSLNLLRWLSPRTIKETFAPPTQVPYPSMA